MNPLRICGLAILLSVLLKAVEATIPFQGSIFKPGECPVINYIVAPTCTGPRRRCIADFQCLGQKKCCDLGCDGECVDPIITPSSIIFPTTPKPGVNPLKSGVCPAVIGIQGQCERRPNQCIIDVSCPGRTKCCPSNGGCGLTCRRPVAAKPIEKLGKCPDTTGIITTCEIKPGHCLNDATCLGNKKCCSYGCGPTCLDPVLVDIPEAIPEALPAYLLKPGQCPDPNSFTGSCKITSRHCTSDAVCRGDEKCCSNGCGYICVPPVSLVVIKDGKCPIRHYIVAPTCTEEHGQCFADYECRGREKCCDLGCGFECTVPDTPQVDVVKPGECPDTTGIVTTCEIKPGHCLSDSSCPRDQKCCSNGCGPTCMTPRPGGASRPGSGGTGRPGTGGAGRPGTGGAGRPGTGGTGATKVGRCPIRHFIVAPTCPEDTKICFADNECPGLQKCCDVGCGLECVDLDVPPKPDVDVVKPGECPDTSGIVTTCEIKPGHCVGDSSCPRDQKCCSNGCGPTCMTPDSGGKGTTTGTTGVTKVGQCPIRRFIVAPMCSEDMNRCFADYECPGLQKCCDIGCGFECVALDSPAKPDLVVNKPGQCPDTNGVIGACVITADYCTSDAVCLDDLKCCSSGCGPACMKPVSESGNSGETKEGRCPTPSFHFAVNCRNQRRRKCSKDEECRGRRKCCNIGCGEECIKPDRPRE